MKDYMVPYNLHKGICYKARSGNTYLFPQLTTILSPLLITDIHACTHIVFPCLLDKKFCLCGFARTVYYPHVDVQLPFSVSPSVLCMEHSPHKKNLIISKDNWYPEINTKIGILLGYQTHRNFCSLTKFNNSFL